MQSRLDFWQFLQTGCCSSHWTHQALVSKRWGDNWAKAGRELWLRRGVELVRARPPKKATMGSSSARTPHHDHRLLRAREVGGENLGTWVKIENGETLHGLPSQCHVWRHGFSLVAFLSLDQIDLAFGHLPPPPPLAGGPKAWKVGQRGKIRWGTTGESCHGISKHHVSGAHAPF